MSLRPPRPLIVALALTLPLGLLATGASSAAQSDSAESRADSTAELANTELSDYGPTGKAPRGSKLPPRTQRNRWKYAGTLGKLGNNKQVVPPVIAPPAKEAGRAPLTGLKSKKKRLDDAAIIVKIDNVALARPQTAINQADIVYEELVEAGATRLAAVFHSKSPSLIGPVRSARSTDIGIAVSFNRPVFAYSGANSIVDRLVARARVRDQGAEIYGNLYFRRGGKPAPHNYYTTTSRQLGQAPNTAKPPPAHFEYRDNKAEPAPDVPAAHTIRLKYERGSGNTVRYEWDPRIEGWRRWQRGSAHRDSSGVQVAPENVIVQIVPYTDAGMTDKFGLDLYEAQMVGSGEAFVFTKGHVIEATWTKPTLRSVTTFTDKNGNHVELTRGRTWVSLVAPNGGFTFDAHKCKGKIATVAGTGGSDTLKGTDQRDIIAGAAGSDVIIGRGGNDLICGGKGDDQIVGGSGNDRIYGSSGADDLRGGDGNDRLYGGSGGDQLHGDAGADRLAGQGGVDQLFAQPEADTLRPGAGDVIVRGR